MKRKIGISVLVVILLVTLSTIVRATTNSTLADEMYAKLSPYGMTTVDKIKIERYLVDHPVTDSEADAVMKKSEEAVSIMDQQGVNNYNQLTNQGKNQVKSIANEAADILGLKLIFKAGSVSVVSKGGSTVDSIHSTTGSQVAVTGPGGFVQTGSDEEDVLEETEIEIKENETVKINEEYREIGTTVFEKLKNTENAKLEVTSGNAVWEFESGKITDTNIVFNPKVDIANKKFEEIKSNKISEAIFIDFNHNGKLPGATKVTLNVGTEKYGEESRTLYLYYYNPETKGYEYVSEASYENGKVSMVLEHCSTYALVEEKIAEEKDNGKRKLDNEPKTGANTIALSFIFVISVMGMIVSKIK